MKLIRVTPEFAVVMNAQGVSLRVDRDEFEALRAIAEYLPTAPEGLVDGRRGACLLADAPKPKAIVQYFDYAADKMFEIEASTISVCLSASSVALIDQATSTLCNNMRMGVRRRSLAPCVLDAGLPTERQVWLAYTQHMLNQMQNIMFGWTSYAITADKNLLKLQSVLLTTPFNLEDWLPTAPNHVAHNTLLRITKALAAGRISYSEQVEEKQHD